MKVAVIITTCNRPDALSAALDAYRAQTEQDFGLIVADDGSTTVTADVINAYRERIPFGSPCVAGRPGVSCREHSKQGSGRDGSAPLAQGI